MVHVHHFITPRISGLANIKLLFSRETETKKVSNLFDLRHMLVQDATMHQNSIVIFLKFSQNLCVNPYKNIEFR